MTREPTAAPRHLHDYSRPRQLTLLRRLAHAALREYGVEAATIRLRRYEDNAVYEVRVDGRHLMLRMSLRDGRTPTEQRSELHWLAELGSAGLAVPRGAAEPDAAVRQLTHPALEQPVTVALLEWLEGRVEPPYDQAGVVADLGRVTARLHRSGAGLRLPAWFDRPSWNADDLFERGLAATSPLARDRLTTAQRRLLRDVGEVVAAGMGRYGDRRQLIHADLHRENVVLTPAGTVGLIDFDDCGFGDPGLDIATLLSSVHRQTRGAAPGTYERCAARYLAGYREVQELPG